MARNRTQRQVPMTITGRRRFSSFLSARRERGNRAPGENEKRPCCAACTHTQSLTHMGKGEEEEEGKNGEVITGVMIIRQQRQQQQQRLANYAFYWRVLSSDDVKSKKTLPAQTRVCIREYRKQIWPDQFIIFARPGGRETLLRARKL